MNIELPNKYNIGDELYHITDQELCCCCDICEGTGQITYKEKVFRCPQCVGDGVDYSNKFKFYLIDDKLVVIDKICCEISKSGVEIVYLDADSSCYDENDLYKTDIKAFVECKKRNKDEKRKSTNKNKRIISQFEENMTQAIDSTVIVLNKEEKIKLEDIYNSLYDQMITKDD